ncbi:MAG: 50S ribosomal protein P1 [Promethearchaeota archaeon]
MEYVYAAMLLHKTGQKITEANVGKVLEAAGTKANEARVKSLVAALKDVNIEEATKMAAIAPVAAPTTTTKAETPAKEKKKEEKVEEEEEATAGLGALFG